MKPNFLKLTILLCSLTSTILAQDTIYTKIPAGFDPHRDKIIPDKVFEIGLPLLFLFLLSNAIVSLIKNRSVNRLKAKLLDKDLSEPTLVALLSEDKSLSKFIYLKWFLILAAMGISFIILPFSTSHEYMPIGIISLMLSFAFLAYYLIIRNK